MSFNNHRVSTIEMLVYIHKIKCKLFLILRLCGVWTRTFYKNRTGCIRNNGDCLATVTAVCFYRYKKYMNTNQSMRWSLFLLLLVVIVVHNS